MGAMTVQFVPTAVKPAAPYVASGVVLTILGGALLLASWYASVAVAQTLTDSGPSVGLAWAGWIALAVGLSLLWVGVLRLVQHADRDAGVTYPGFAAPVDADD